MPLIKNLSASSVHWHRFFAWLGGIVLCLYILSAITHPLMSWTGPKAAKFFPPTAEISAKHLQAIANIITKHRLSAAKVVKVIPSKEGPVLQITQDEQSARRYFDLASYEEKHYYDSEHAAWLAHYYLGKGSGKQIASITRQDQFDNSYPWVNRLLPVYKVVMDDNSNTTLYIYTELNALAGISNDWKVFLQSTFKVLHTWSFLDSVDHVRVVFLSLVIISLMLFILSGIGLVFSFKARKIKQASRRWHRRIAYIIWLPLLGFSTSGFYHLLQSAYGENTSGLKLHTTLLLSQDNFTKNLEAFSQQKFGLLNQVSIVSAPSKPLLYRISIPPQTNTTQPQKDTDEHAHHHAKPIDRAARFRGISQEKGGIYFEVGSGKLSTVNDQLMAQTIAVDYLQESENAISDISLVTHFGPNYDFRNKRLPVWRVDFANTKNDIVFVDPSTGVIVDHTTQNSRYERYSFSLLHKWNFLVPLMGRQNRDIVIVMLLLSALFASIAGFIMLLKKRKNKH